MKAQIESKFEIYINNELYHKAKDKTDAIWSLGAKFSGLTYNKMYNDGKIEWLENSVRVTT